MFRQSIGVLAALASSSLLLLVCLTGCAPEPKSVANEGEPQTPTTVRETVEPTPNPSETPSAPSIVVPSCDEILPIESIHAFLNDDRVERHEVGPDGLERLASEPFGPSAVAAYQGALQLTHCTWGYPQSDGFADVVFAELSPESTASFTAALEDSVFVKRTSGAAVIYEDLDPQRRKSLPVRHGFIGNIWVGTTGSISGYFFEPALTRMSELNPAVS